MDVTWDDAKNQTNINKRHLPLSLGGLVLDDEMRIERHDDEHSGPEQDRWQTIGIAGKVLFMVYTEAGEIPHIISVRLADIEEKRLYYGERNLQASGWYRVNPGGTSNAGGSGKTLPGL
ncbi:MAG: BrnT family toxin [Treponema sp.]|nr:BrnT family toxin [Treponema sp.]